MASFLVATIPGGGGRYGNRNWLRGEGGDLQRERHDNEDEEEEASINQFRCIGVFPLLLERDGDDVEGKNILPSSNEPTSYTATNSTGIVPVDNKS